MSQIYTSYKFKVKKKIKTTTHPNLSLFQRPVLFDDWSFNGVVLNLLLAAIYEDKDGVIHLPLYNFTDPSLYKYVAIHFCIADSVVTVLPY
jgi:hypothetical protein